MLRYLVNLCTTSRANFHSLIPDEFIKHLVAKGVKRVVTLILTLIGHAPQINNLQKKINTLPSHSKMSLLFLELAPQRF